jgi:2'-5' RNA ligase
VTSRGEKVRVFVAAYPPAEVAMWLRREVERLALTPGTWASDPHLTLQFVGPVGRPELDSIRESVERAASGLARFVVRPIRLVLLPQCGPRLIAAELSQPSTLAELHHRLAQRLARTPERGTYLPHITVMRWNGPKPTPIEPVAVDGPEFEVCEVCLMRSVLRPDGAEHHLLGRVRLGDAR